jgi:peptidoglycan hydrolase-like protein with peptidoglycan-binding domain
MYKNFIIALAIVVVTGTGLVASSASALSANDVQSQIARLMQQIQDLTAQITRLKAQIGTTDPTRPDVIGSPMPSKHRICYLLTRNLGQGAQGDDVRGLQEFLRENKFLAVEPTGYFGQITAEAVRKWQANEGVSAVGAFGPMSRERLKIWCGGNQNQERFSASPTRGDAPLTVTFDSYISGFRVPSVYYTIDFGDGNSERTADCPAPADACTGPGENKHTYSHNGTYTATLNKITDPCPPVGDGPRCLAAIQSEVVAKQQITVGPVACTKEYKPVCGAQPIVCITTPCNPIPTTYGNRCEMNADGASFLYEGQCRTENPADDPQCKAWFDGCNSCARNNPGEPAACTLKYCVAPGKAYCTARFGDAGNKAPVISGLSGPTTLQEDISGTWTVNAKDPEGGTLSYQVWWGDENVYASNYTTAAPAREFTQSTSFSHTYSNPGTYTVSVTVRDSGGAEAKTTTTVHVGDGWGGTDCTADAMQCPNGNWVGRTGPNCQFVCN